MHVCFPIVWQSYFCKIFIDTVDVLFFAGAYFRGQLWPSKFAGIKIRATSTGCDIYDLVYSIMQGDQWCLILEREISQVGPI